MLRDTLRQIYRNIIEQRFAGAILQLLVSEGRRHPKLLVHYHADVVRRGGAAVARIVVKGRASGEFSVDGDLDVAQVIMGPVISTVFERFFSDVETLNVAELCETHVQLTLRSLTAKNATRQAD